MEIIQRLKREGVKNVNMLAAVILPIEQKQQYKE